ncbi:MAG: hypothetical protein A3K67_04770 [Euryarchaeota archaeon RBG_16_62_10]|nr:MAG: hypothetical protein A3K67_04770 [Euryarchaeota archaeon RBG_16_62_10]
MPRTAFMVLKSPLEQDPTHTVKRFADRQEASAVLLEDGVFHATVAGAAERLGEVAHEVLVCREDLEARGFAAGDLKVGAQAEYSDIIDLIMERTERTVTV